MAGIKWGSALPPEVVNNVAAVATFGDVADRAGGSLPSQSAMFGSKAIDLCNPNDPICHAGPGNEWSGHTEGYIPVYTTQAAAFVASKLLAGTGQAVPGFGPPEYGSQAPGYGSQPPGYGPLPGPGYGSQAPEYGQVPGVRPAGAGVRTNDARVRPVDIWACPDVHRPRIGLGDPLMGSVVVPGTMRAVVLIMAAALSVVGVSCSRSISGLPRPLTSVVTVLPTEDEMSGAVGNRLNTYDFKPFVGGFEIMPDGFRVDADAAPIRCAGVTETMLRVTYEKVNVVEAARQSYFNLDSGVPVSGADAAGVRLVSAAAAGELYEEVHGRLAQL